MPLAGDAAVQPSKNATLPILAATVLAGGPCRVAPVARLRDVETTLEILTLLGARVAWRDGGLDVDTTDVEPKPIGEDLTGKMRASVLFLGPLLARFGEARASLPGGCRLGERPIDFHLQGFESLGAKAAMRRGQVRLSWPLAGRAPRKVQLSGISVGATENVIMAACGAPGTSVGNSAREPEVGALADALGAFGRKISGQGTSTLVAEGDVRGAGRVAIPPDRIVAGTLACAFLASGGEGRVAPYPTDHLEAFTSFLRSVGARAEMQGDALAIAAPGRLQGVSLSTGPHPAFPTDLQPMATALLCAAKGTSRVTETIFESRHFHLDRLRRMGAKVVREGRRFIINGSRRLKGARVSATDLRCAAALLVAGLGAKGETVLVDEGHLARGYDGLPDILSGLGARLS